MQSQNYYRLVYSVSVSAEVKLFPLLHDHDLESFHFIPIMEMLDHTLSRVNQQS